MKKIYVTLVILSFTTALNAQCWKDYSTGRYFSAVIKTDGTLWTWGNNYSGQLGHGTFDPANIPTQVGNNSDWKMVAAGGDHTIAMKTDGTLWAWGYNSSGQLGINTGQIYSNIPIQIGQDSDWESFSTGYSHVLAIKEDGSLWGWGYNANGRLGTGTNTLIYSAPVQITQTYDWKTVSLPDGSSSAALKTDGSLWTWGRNAEGQLGLGNSDDVAVPTQVGTDLDWKVITTAGYSMSAIKSDGTLWSWGSNYLGNFGNGTTTSTTIPVQIGTDSDWETIKLNAEYTLATKNNASLWQIGIRFSTFSVPLELMNLEPAEINCSMVTTVDVPFCAYPNPTNDQLNFQNTTDQPIEEIIVSTQAGVVLIDVIGNIYQLDVSSLHSGIYNLTILSAGESHHFNIYKN